jgi:hypothetical protein
MWNSSTRPWYCVHLLRSSWSCCLCQWVGLENDFEVWMACELVRELWTGENSLEASTAMVLLLLGEENCGMKSSAAGIDDQTAFQVRYCIQCHHSGLH